MWRDIPRDIKGFLMATFIMGIFLTFMLMTLVGDWHRSRGQKPLSI